MGTDLDAAVFFGLHPVSLPDDGSWEEVVGAHGCDVVFTYESTALAIASSIARHSTWGMTTVPPFAEQPDWPERLARCCAALGIDATGAGAPRWWFDARFC